MPRCSGKLQTRGPSSAFELEAGPKTEPNPDLARFWESLPLERRRKLLSVDRRSLFTRIRQQFCSRCFGNASPNPSGLFVLRYEEMKGAAALDCPACQEFYAGLAVSDGGDISVEKGVLETEPFTLFAEGKLREREREMQFMTGDICGSGFQKRAGNNMCALHCSPVPVEALVEYFKELPEEHKLALLTLREEDFAAELDAHLKYQLRICRDCRCNVMREYRDLKPPTRGSQGTEMPRLELSPDFTMRVADRLVTVSGEGVTDFFNRAEDVEGCKGLDGDDLYNNPDKVRHAETPELAREALVDSAVLIYKSQIEVAFREQTAGHNALLLFVGLALQLMEEQLYNAFKELKAKEAEAELLDLVAKEKEKSQPSGKKKKGKKGGKAAEKEEAENEGGKPPAAQQCRQCAALQQSCRCITKGGGGSPVRGSPVSPLRPVASPAAWIAGGSRCSPRDHRLHDVETGDWEVQHPKRRNATQVVKKGGAVGSLGGSSSGSTTPEPSWRSSLESSMRSRSSFAKRVVVVRPSEPKRPIQKPTAAPMHAYSCGDIMPPPPPPPPREAKPSSRAAPEQKQNAWQAGGQLPASIRGQHATAAEWNPWNGPSPALDQRSSVRGAAAPVPVGGGMRMAFDHSLKREVGSQQAVVHSILAHDAFSLFHFSPVPQPAGPLQEAGAAEREPSSYQLFGSSHSSYPLAALGTVLSL